MENPLPEDALPEEEDFNDPEPEPPKNRSAYSVLNGVQTIVSIALVMATLLTLWNPRKVFSTSNLTTLLAEEAAQETREAEAANNQTRIAIIAGHWQDNNPGEVCADGLIESDVNYDIAGRAAQKLEKLGYTVNLFPEYDLDFLNYEGTVLIAIYSGSCADDPAPASGFKVGGSYSATNPDQIDLLATCISQEYQKATSLPFTYEVINSEHEAYHIFRDISLNTPAVLLELGSLNTDRKILLNRADNTAEGIVSGILCFMSNLQGSGQ